MIDITALPDEVAEYIVKLRKEAASFRIQRNELRAQLAELRAASS